MGLPVTYYGGKGQQGPLRRIINQFPEHDYYIETFLGRGRIFEAKRPAPLGSYGFELSMGLAAEWAKRDGLQFRCADGVEGAGKLLATFGPDAKALVYADPPYLFSTRKGQRQVYAAEWSQDDHARFLDAARAWPAMVAISHPRCAMYDQLLTGWRRMEYQSQTRGGLMDECLWMNYPNPDRLHQSTYFGDSFRERERYKRQSEIIGRRLAALPRPLALAILEGLQDRFSRDGAPDTR